MKNIIDAISTLVRLDDNRLSGDHSGSNRINAVGYALEDYIKNLFADGFNCSERERREKWSATFSYLGNDANPPDIILKGGDAIEVKKDSIRQRRIGAQQQLSETNFESRQSVAVESLSRGGRLEREGYYLCRRRRERQSD